MLLIFGSGGISDAILKAWDGEAGALPKDICDVRNRVEVRDAYDFHDPEYVVCTAGISQPNGSAYTAALEVETNLIGSINVAMLAPPEARVVLLGSVAGLYGKPGHVGYSASKAGVISVVQSLALEGRKIWCVSPGRVDTPMRERDYPADTPGSRLEAGRVAHLIVIALTTDIYPVGANIVIRKEGLEKVIVQAHEGDGWREQLRVGEPVTI